MVCLSIALVWLVGCSDPAPPPAPVRCDNAAQGRCYDVGWADSEQGYQVHPDGCGIDVCRGWYCAGYCDADEYWLGFRTRQCDRCS